MAPIKPKNTTRTALISVTGMSPAIVTETVWALAHEKPAVIPDDVHVLTTSRGAADLQRELLTPRPDLAGRTVWQTLRETLLGAKASADQRLTLHEPIHLSIHDTAQGQTRPLEDIRTPEDNAAAAEIILDEIRRLTANDDLRLIASLAGGRKTMSALLACAMSLLGRKDDRLTHVLVNEPFDHPALQPRFYFPTKPVTRHTLTTATDKQTVTSDQAVLQLADVPFVPLRYLFRDQLGRFPGRFMDLIRSATQLVSETTEPVALDYDPKTYTAYFDGVAVEFRNRDVPFFEFLYQRVKQGLPPWKYHDELTAPFAEFLAAWIPQHPDVNLSFSGQDWAKKPPEKDDFRRRLNSLRQRLNESGLPYLIPRLFPPHGPVGIPPEQVVLEQPQEGKAKVKSQLQQGGRSRRA